MYQYYRDVTDLLNHEMVKIQKYEYLEKNITSLRNKKNY